MEHYLMRKVARRLLLEQSQFALYRVLPDGALRLVPPTPDRHALFQEAHAGKFGGHLREQKVYSARLIPNFKHLIKGCRRGWA